jgi:hypothetical protein
MRSGFSREGVYQCSYWRASAYIGGPNLLTWQDIYHFARFYNIACNLQVKLLCSSHGSKQKRKCRRVRFGPL